MVSRFEYVHRFYNEQLLHSRLTPFKVEISSEILSFLTLILCSDPYNNVIVLGNTIDFTDPLIPSYTALYRKIKYKISSIW